MNKNFNTACLEVILRALDAHAPSTQYSISLSRLKNILDEAQHFDAKTRTAWLHYIQEQSCDTLSDAQVAEIASVVLVRALYKYSVKIGEETALFADEYLNEIGLSRLEIRNFYKELLSRLVDMSVPID